MVTLGTLRSRFRTGTAIAILGVVAVACNEGSEQEISAEAGAIPTTSETSSTLSTPQGLYDGFRLIGDEAVGLNGRENENRPPIQFLLLADSGEPAAIESDLLDRYAKKLEEDGWEVFPYEASDDWWTIQANKGASYVRVGTISLFHERAKISEGYSRTVFRELATVNPEPMIVVSIDPAG